MPEVIIVGAGPGGYAAAFRAAGAGASVALVEKAEMGGVCLNSGCIPTKTLKASAEALEIAHRFHEFGIEPSGSSADGGTSGFGIHMAAVLARKEKVRKVLAGGLKKSCAALKIRVVHGQAELLPHRAVLVRTANGTEKLAGDAVILSPGSKALNLPALPIDHTRILSSDDALNLDSVPRRMLIVGGGVIGCELAFIFKIFGAEVTLVEGMERLLPLPAVDEEVSRLLLREAKKRGLRVLLGQTVKGVDLSGSGATCRVGPASAAGAAGDGVVIEADVVLSAAGRAPNFQDMRLTGAGVNTDAKGWIIADDRMRTTADGVYAVGDALGPGRVMLAHVASAEGVCAVENLLGNEKRMDYSVIPSAIFTSPEIGVVGLSESQAKEQGYTVRSVLVQCREMGKAHAMGELSGFFKLVCEEDSGKILGAHIAGAHATDLVAEAALAVKNGLTCKNVADTVHAHPTLAEGLQEAAQAWMQLRHPSPK